WWRGGRRGCRRRGRCRGGRRRAVAPVAGGRDRVGRQPRTGPAPRRVLGGRTRPGRGTGGGAVRRAGPVGPAVGGRHPARGHGPRRGGIPWRPRPRPPAGGILVVRPEVAMRIALFITCVNDLLYPATGQAVVRILERLGHTVEFPSGQ